MGEDANGSDGEIAVDPKVDQARAKEAEDRLAAYERGEILAVDLADVLAKYGLN